MSKYITIGMDLGNKKHTVCALDQAGNVLWRRDVANTPEALKPFFDANAGATVAMETGLCCRWISALAKSCGCDVLVGNALRPSWHGRTSWLGLSGAVAIARTCIRAATSPTAAWSLPPFTSSSRPSLGSVPLAAPQCRGSARTPFALATVGKSRYVDVTVMPVSGIA